MGLGGLEPPTSRLSGVRSNQLSYRPTPRNGREEAEPLVSAARSLKPSLAAVPVGTEPSFRIGGTNRARPDKSPARLVPGPKLQKERE